MYVSLTTTFHNVYLYNALNSKYIVMQVNIICRWQGYQTQGKFLCALNAPYNIHYLAASCIRIIFIYYALHFLYAPLCNRRETL